MSVISLECEVTEYGILPATENTINVFSISNDALIINFCDEIEKVLHQSEISAADAIELAHLILMKYKK